MDPRGRRVPGAAARGWAPFWVCGNPARASPHTPARLPAGSAPGAREGPSARDTCMPCVAVLSHYRACRSVARRGRRVGAALPHPPDLRAVKIREHETRDTRYETQDKSTRGAWGVPRYLSPPHAWRPVEHPREGLRTPPPPPLIAWHGIALKGGEAG